MLRINNINKLFLNFLQLELSCSSNIAFIDCVINMHLLYVRFSVIPSWYSALVQFAKTEPSPICRPNSTMTPLWSNLEKIQSRLATRDLLKYFFPFFIKMEALSWGKITQTKGKYFRHGLHYFWSYHGNTINTYFFPDSALLLDII